MKDAEALYNLIVQAGPAGFPVTEIDRLKATDLMNELLAERRIHRDRVGQCRARTQDDDTLSTKTEYKEKNANRLLRIGELNDENATIRSALVKKNLECEDLIHRLAAANDSVEERNIEIQEVHFRNEVLNEQLVEANNTIEDLKEQLFKAQSEIEELSEARSKNYSFHMIHVELFIIMFMLILGFGWTHFVM